MHKPRYIPPRAQQAVLESTEQTELRAAASEPVPLRRFLWSRFAGQTAQNALLYALLIAVVARSGTSLGSTLLVVAFLVPSIVLGIPGGVLADLLPKRLVLVGVLILRAAIAAGLLFVGDGLLPVYLLVLALATVGQVFGPAEAAVLPRLVPPERLARGNAAMNFVLIAAQVLGAVALAPLVIKVAGERSVFGIAAFLFVVAAWQMLRVRGLDAELPSSVGAQPRKPGAGGALAAGWHIIKEDRDVLRALVRLTLVGTVIKIVIAVAPMLARDVLHIGAANTVFVMAPAALGSIVGLMLAPPLAPLVGRSTLSLCGSLLFALGTILLALTTEIGNWLAGRSYGYFEGIVAVTSVPSVVTVAMLVAVVLGLAFAVTAIAVRTLINERAPHEYQGRVFATQLTLADAASLVPLVGAGALADVVGVNTVLLISGGAFLLVELYLLGAKRRMRPVAVPAP